MQLRKESLKKSGLPGFEPWPLRYRCSALTNWANKPTGSQSLNWFVIYLGKMKMKLWIYEIHIFELRNEEINVNKILAVINATYAVAKRKPEKIRLAGIRTLTSAIPVQRSNQLSYQANWELVITLVRNIPGKDEDEIMNGSNPGKPDFFRLSFRNCISCVNNCEDLIYIYFFIPQFKYMNFIYS